MELSRKEAFDIVTDLISNMADKGAADKDYLYAMNYLSYIFNSREPVMNEEITELIEKYGGYNDDTRRTDG